jgi:hypothetical protein
VHRLLKVRDGDGGREKRARGREESSVVEPTFSLLLPPPPAPAHPSTTPSPRPHPPIP